MLKLKLCLTTMMIGAALMGSVHAADTATPPDSQTDLKPVINTGGKELTFDWPLISRDSPVSLSPHSPARTRRVSPA